MTQDNRPLPAVQQQQGGSLLSQVELDPRIAQVARAIQIMGGKDDRTGRYKLTEEMAVAAAMYQAGTGQLVGRDFYMHEKLGRMEGYRGVARDAVTRGVGEVEIKYRQLTDEERREYEIEDGDSTVACEVYQLRAWRMAQSKGKAYSPIVGVGVVRLVEKYDPKTTAKWNDALRRMVPEPKERWQLMKLTGGMTWHEKAKNRAYKSALRHTPGMAVSGDEVLADALVENPGMEMPPETARLSVEQAVVWAEKQQEQQARAEMSDEEQAAERAELQERIGRGRLQQQYDDWSFSDMPCPYCKILPEQRLHKVDCAFRSLYPRMPLPPGEQPEEGEFRIEDETRGDEAGDEQDLDGLQAELIGLAMKGGDAAPDDRTQKAMLGSLSNLFGSDKTGIKAFIKWAWGVDKAADMTLGMCQAATAFVSSTKVGDDWVPSEKAIRSLALWRSAYQGQPALIE